ncbi:MULTISPECIES: hypothetical protein [unclassified Sphingobium]|uniref:hypothetical protein n=1 Tax=unclassified Sphingobium TaxID=2611147 RepID=UPI0007F4C809|nr:MULTISPECIES: hypothetical protein [unclassified Sphingobium]OAN59457.1 hypothetical protein A7Q26_00620 [Sphingobium sp. TCM1]WIW90121.1 hypothetical protein K3M67_18850 [Sphingobium sp. V4]
MSLYTTIHLHNVPSGREGAYARWFDGKHQDDLARLRGLRSADRYAVTPEQIMPDIPQPWAFLSVYEFDYPAPEIDLPALGPLLAEARDAGLIDDSGDTERIHSYAMYGDWAFSPNHRADQPFSGVSIILANFVAGREAEYHHWYDTVHAPEVTRVPGKVAMKRGRLSSVQIQPRHYCPGSDLVFCAQQTDDLLFTVKDFSARARGVSPSGVAFAPRSAAGSFARTVHYFSKVSGARFWPGGIAYDGDLSVYPADFARPAG